MDGTGSGTFWSKRATLANGSDAKLDRLSVKRQHKRAAFRRDDPEVTPVGRVARQRDDSRLGGREGVLGRY